MRFRLFGIPVEVQPGFWLVTVLLGLDYLRSDFKIGLLIWAAVLLVSILVHELGHAFAVVRYGMKPEITLHMMGGLCAWAGTQRVSRLQRIFISFAGPLAGFVLGGLVWAITKAAPDLMTVESVNKITTAEVARIHTLKLLTWVNIGWGLVNLLPVLPLDGGHILEQALGPDKRRTTAIISLATGGAVALLCLVKKDWVADVVGVHPVYTGMLFAMFAVHSYMRIRDENPQDAAVAATPQAPRAPPKEPLPPEVTAQLEAAREALDDDELAQAVALAQLLLNEDPPAAGKVAALEIIAWARLLEGDSDAAARAVRSIEKHGEADLALIGSVLFAKEDFAPARQVFEVARAGGDDRKEVVGPLIQILIKQGEVARAAACALDIVETLSDEDTRQMASIAREHDCHSWASRLSEALFERNGDPDDAYIAACGRALDGDSAGSLALLRRAVAAGFSDAARAWADDALTILRASSDAADELDSVLPKPANGASA